MILNLRDVIIANAKIIMLKSRCDYLRRRIARPQEADFAKAEVQRLEMRIGELTQQLRLYHELLRKTSCANKHGLSPQIAVNELAEQLIKRRIRAKLTQAELAQAVGTSRQVISKYERTRYSGVTLKRLIKIDTILRLYEAASLTETSL